MLLSDVCLSRTSGLTRTERPGKTKIGPEVAHVTRDSDTTFKVKKSKVKCHQAALLTAVLTSQAAATVSVGTYWPWETTITLRSARRREALRRPQREERGGGISWRPPAYSLLSLAVRLKLFYFHCFTVRFVFRLDALALSVIATATWLGGCHTPVLYQNG